MAPTKEDIRPAKPEEQELARKREEQSALETELAERELRAENLRAELGAFERRYLHEVGMRYAQLDELKAQIAERAASNQPGADRAQQTARDARARADVRRAGGRRLGAEILQGVAGNEAALSGSCQAHPSRSDFRSRRAHATRGADGGSQQGLRSRR